MPEIWLLLDMSSDGSLIAMPRTVSDKRLRCGRPKISIIIMPTLTPGTLHAQASGTGFCAGVLGGSFAADRFSNWGVEKVT